jgi:type IV secretory pathway VirB10-like protein
MMAADETPAGIRQNATRLTMQAVYEQLRAVVLSGEWAELGYDSVQAYVDEVRGPYAIRFDVPERRQRVAELTAAGVPVTEQAALLGVARSTVNDDRVQNRPKPEPAQQVTEPEVSEIGADDEWPEDDLDAEPEPEPEPEPPPRDPAAIAATRAALEAQMRESKEQQALTKRADLWWRVSDLIVSTVTALGAATAADPSIDSWWLKNPGSAPENLELLQARAAELAGLLTAIQAATQTTGLRRVK